jgi:hypothetical protein
MVNWRRVQLPKRLGGLGVIDLTKFNKAMCLRWQWDKWKGRNKPWVQLPIATSAEEQALRACTTITVGNGAKTKFWHDRRLHNQRPIELAPALYRLAWQKNIMVNRAMVQGNWMKGLHRISTTEEIQQFVALWQQLRAFDLSDREDEIAWKFSSTSSYSSKSAYKMQYAGTFPDFEWAEIWNTKVENKCRFFSWLILQNRL